MLKFSRSVNPTSCSMFNSGCVTSSTSNQTNEAVEPATALDWLCTQLMHQSSAALMVPKHLRCTLTNNDRDWLAKYFEAVWTFRDQLIHGVLQIIMHITFHCVLHQCLSQGICSCTCMWYVCKHNNKSCTTQQHTRCMHINMRDMLPSCWQAQLFKKKH